MLGANFLSDLLTSPSIALGGLLGVDPVAGGMGGLGLGGTALGEALGLGGSTALSSGMNVGNGSASGSAGMGTSYFPPTPGRERDAVAPSAPTTVDPRGGRGGLLGNILNLGGGAAGGEQGGRSGLLGLNLFNLDPSMQTAIALGMIGGGSNSGAFTNAAEIYSRMSPQVEARKEKAAERNQTLAFLDKEAPDIAKMVRAGMPTAEGWALYKSERSGAGKDMTANMKEYQAAKAEGYKGTFAEWVKGDQSGKTDQFGLPVSGSISQKARALMAQGFDEQTAIGVASGRYDVSINPVNGERVLIDVATQQIVPLRMAGQGGNAGGQAPSQGGQQQGAQARPAGAQGKTLYQMADDATGVYSGARTGLANTIGQIPGPIGEAAQAPKQVEAQQAFDLFKRDLIRSLSVNPKFPVAEMQRIEGLVPRGVMTSGETLKSSLRVLDQELARIEQEVAAGINDTNMPVEQRQADIITLRGVRAARERLGIETGGSGGNVGAPPVNGGAVDDYKQRYGLR